MPRPRLEMLEERVVPTILNISPTEVGVFRNGKWILDNNDNHQLDSTDQTFNFGTTGDIPITGDWNADGHTKVGVFRNVKGLGVFSLDYNGDRVFDAGDRVFTFGLGTDTPIVGDWDGTGRDKVGIFRNVNGSGLFVFDTLGHQQFDSTSTVFAFGLGTDKPVIGDWNGDGTSKAGVFRNVKGAGVFILDTTGNHVFNNTDQVFSFGAGTDTPVIGDWNGDTRTKVGVVRDNGHGALVWTLDFNGNTVYDVGDLVFVYGVNTDVPVVGQW